MRLLRLLLPLWLAYVAVALILPAQGHDEDNGSASLPAEGSGAALDQMLQALTRDTSFAARATLAYWCSAVCRNHVVSTRRSFLAARRLSQEFVLRHTFDAELCAASSRWVPAVGRIGSAPARGDICQSGGIKRKCEEPHVALDLLQTDVIPLQKKRLRRWRTMPTRGRMSTARHSLE